MKTIKRGAISFPTNAASSLRAEATIQTLEGWVGMMVVVGGGGGGVH